MISAGSLWDLKIEPELAALIFRENMEYIKVLINKKIAALDHDFIYQVPPELIGEVTVGSVVSVPFGHTTEKGIVIGFIDAPPDFNVKYIDGILNENFLFPEDLLVLAERLSSYYMTTTMAMLKAMIPRGINLFGKAQNAKTEMWLFPDDIREEHLPNIKGKKQRELASFLIHNGATSKKELAERGFSDAVCNGLVKNGFAQKKKKNILRYSYRDLTEKNTEIPALTVEQHQAFTAITQRRPDDHRPVLIHGVTGSGKTELYLRLAEKTLKEGKQVIVLLPEIALTPQFVGIFERRFHGKIALFHSRLSDGERRDSWYSFRNGETGIALGARSCVFAPAKDLGLIIIDEEHEDSYEQDSAPRFHARKAAQMRCEICGADLVLGSATPSFETYSNALLGKYFTVTLKNRVKGTPLPAITTVDMREELRQGWTEILSRELLSRMNETLKNGKQIMLFLNRLGYYTFVSCRDCGFVYRCPHCGVSLTYYQQDHVLRCNRCDFQRKMEDRCPSCKSKRVKYFGLGIEQLEEVVRRHFPHAVIDRLDSDSVRKKGSVDMVYERMQSGETQILIGTRMIAKGWDFPNVSLIGIIAADYSLNFPDFRSGEKTFQMISQVAGRCGRGDDRGDVVLQTYRPEEPALILGGLQDYDSYYHLEAKKRRQFGYPPFTHMMKIIFTMPSDYYSKDEIKKFRELFHVENNEIKVFGPSPGIYREKGREKWIITFLGKEDFPIKMLIQKGISRLKSEKLIDKNIIVQIETDPIHSV